MKTIYTKLLFFMLLLPLSVFAQSTLEGVVTDKVSKQPMPGVNVTVQGTQNGTQTDFDGKYKLVKIKAGDKINFSYIGYKSQTVTYNGLGDLNVAIEEESNQLQEVVVQVGYGTAKKKDATGSVALVTSKDFNKGAIVSTDQLLAGKAAGVRITNDGGSPDSAPNIRIRGGGSLNASNNPLIVIDGVPISDLNPAGVSNPFTLVNPSDVESFSILKDASATAIYGVRASNGVILITTKKGTSGAPQFSYSATVSVSKVTKMLDVMNASDFTRFVRNQKYVPLVIKEDGSTFSYTNYLGIDDPTTDIQDDLDTPQIEGRILYNTNWQKEIMRTAISTDHTFSVRANLYKKVPFRFSLGYNNTQGVVKTSDYQRFSYSFKLTPKFLNDDLKVDINAKGTYSDKNAIDENGSIGNTLSMDPTKPIYGTPLGDRFGGYYQATYEDFKNKGTASQTSTYKLSGAYNPVALLNQRRRPERVTRFLGNAEFDYKMWFLKDLRAVVNLGLDASISRIAEIYSDRALATYQNLYVADPNSPSSYVFNPGLNYGENQTNTNKTMDAYFVYTKNLTGFVTRIDAQAGYSYQNFISEGNKQQFIYDSATGLRTPEVDSENRDRSYYNPLNLQAFFGRANIDFRNRYLLTATFRADGTSLFLPNKRWGYFPAIGLAWKVKEESFLKDVDFVQDFKLRASWGKTGQAGITDAVGYFPTRPFFEIGTNTGQYLPGYTTYTARPYNPDITWEKTTTYNLGLDFEIFKRGILSGSVDVFKRKTDDLLATVPVLPGQSTASSEFISNVGSIEGEGFETALNVKIFQKEKFTWAIGGNIAYSYNTVKSLEGVSQVQDKGSGLNQTGVYLAQSAVGHQPYSAWVYEQVYDANGQPIVGAYVDRNNDGKITNDDRYYAAIRPNWTFGFNTTVTVGDFDFAANFRGQIGGQIYNLKTLTNGSLSSVTPQTPGYLNNVLDFYSGAANPLFKDFLGNATFSDYLLQDATFLRCDNISAGYKIKKFVEKSTLRISASVNNVFILTKYTGQDPENFNGIDRTFYPRPRTFTLGVNLDF
ncbi:MAG: TonB-dependent receptor [Bacteroidetes bacterium]|nr:TonB-dependent receptor [Bacteroidota bacterium]